MELERHMCLGICNARSTATAAALPDCVMRVCGGRIACIATYSKHPLLQSRVNVVNDTSITKPGDKGIRQAC